MNESLKVRSEVSAAKVKDLLHEGTVRRITVKNDQGHTIMEIPVTARLVAAVVAPVLTAVAAIAARHPAMSRTEAPRPGGPR